MMLIYSTSDCLVRSEMPSSRAKGRARRWSPLVGCSSRERAGAEASTIIILQAISHLEKILGVNANLKRHPSNARRSG